MGHVYGEVIIEGLEVKDGRKEKFKIPFKNENILAVREEIDGSETVLMTPETPRRFHLIKKLTLGFRSWRQYQILFA